MPPRRHTLALRTACWAYLLLLGPLSCLWSAYAVAYCAWAHTAAPANPRYWELQAYLWMAAAAASVALAVAAAWWLRCDTRSRESHDDRACPHCGYDRAGLPHSQHCPECGAL